MCVKEELETSTSAKSGVSLIKWQRLQKQAASEEESDIVGGDVTNNAVIAFGSIDLWETFDKDLKISLQ